MKFIEQGKDESLTDHLIRNAGPLGLSLEQLARLRKAWVLQGGKVAEQRRARSIAAGVRDEVAKARRAEAREAGRLERARPGGGLEPFNDAGAVRMKSQDGLANLAEAGKLTDAEVAVALRYRSILELESSDLRSALDDSVSSGDPAGLDSFRFHRAKAGVLREEIEQAVVAAARAGRGRRAVRELTVLRKIAGYGDCMEAMAPGGSMRAVYLAALIRALDAAAKAISRWEFDAPLTDTSAAA